ncbi:MAG: phosphoribosylglycinamide formyltransferase [Flavobacteriaceae bacterium]|nr:phosphoribosylglycinamide formyltransferase [Flavobacteriaceae bacterium]
MINLAVFISGNGSNLQAIIDRWQNKKTAYLPKIVFCNNPDAYGLKRAQKAGIKTVVISHKDFKKREDFDREVNNILEENQIELIALAGFMRLLSSWFVKRWLGKILNIHPSLLPAFAGLDAQKQALAYGVKVSGCSVFFVDQGIDTGAIIEQSVVEVKTDDNVESLSNRILEFEHKIFPEALNKVALGEVILDNGRVVFKKN